MAIVCQQKKFQCRSGERENSFTDGLYVETCHTDGRQESSFRPEGTFFHKSGRNVELTYHERSSIL